MLDSPGFLSRAQLENFWVDGIHLPLLDKYQAIHNPQEPVKLDATLSVYSVPGSKYDDGDSSKGIWRYGYTGDKPGGRNINLRRAYELQLPIIYYDWIAAKQFAPLFPVYVVEDHPDELHVVLQDESVYQLGAPEDDTPVEAAFRNQVVRARIYQREFRARVVSAYETRCAICALPHGALLDAAHIRPYGEQGATVAAAKDVTNGISLCAIHHRAYDRKLLGIDGERRMYVSPEVATIQDGPVLASSLQSIDGKTMQYAPKSKFAPDPDRLEKTFKEFLASLPH